MLIMTPAELKIKYPDAVEMIDHLLNPNNVSYGFTASRTVDKLDDGQYHWNYEGTDSTIYSSLENLVKALFGNQDEKDEAESESEGYQYSSYLSGGPSDEEEDDSIGEVYLDDNGNVAWCDYENSDFTLKQLNKARRELNMPIQTATGQKRKLKRGL